MKSGGYGVNIDIILGLLGGVWAVDLRDVRNLAHRRTNGANKISIPGE
jgi:hypothetical protein